MNFISLTEHFRASASLAERAIGKSAHLPILSHFLLNVEKNRIYLSATNLEVAVVTSFTGKVEETGAITVPARLILDFLSHLGEEKVEATIQKNTLRLASGNYKATFQGLDPEEFPIIPKIQNESKLFIPNEGLKTALTQVVNAASTSETRQELAGVFCQYDPEGTLKFVATDSFRLAEKTYQLNGTNSPKVKIAAFLPLRSAQEVIRVSQDRSGDVGIAIDQNQILFSWEDTEFTSRLLEAEFPAYASIIPKQFLSEVGVSRKKFLEALRVTGVFSSKINDVKISIQPPDKMVLRAANAAVGENEAVLPADIRGQAGEAAFNYKFLIDGVENIFQDKVVFGVNQDTAPALIRGEADPSYFYLIMPIRL